MTKAKKTDPTYLQLQLKLDKIIEELSKGEQDVDEALNYYREGLELVDQLNTYLKSAENKISELKTEFGSD
ncbi:MAG TPA: exodeoxyribonuclease VII small subunit [Candidatus Saccharimonadales bacterium]|nr:exodeoxyribonuclease VII small subunit [Candidatus Saccharimonadales bacterium]